MFTILDKCYHRPRSCDMLQELRDVQEAIRTAEKKNSPDVPVGTPGAQALGGMLEWLCAVMSGRAKIDSAPRYCWDYVQQDGQDSDVAFTEYLYKLADYIREIADCRKNWDDYQKERAALTTREAELKKRLDIK